MLAGEPIRKDDPEYAKFSEAVARTIKLSAALNASTYINQIRTRVSEITDSVIDVSTIIFIPFHINFGLHTRIGKNVFINHGCSFLDIGGITIEDDVLIGPQVKITTENHPLDPEDRSTLLLKSVRIRRNAWLGTGAIILLGVTVGENSVVAAGAVVSKDVPANTIVGGIPAKILKSI